MAQINVIVTRDAEYSDEITVIHAQITGIVTRDA